MPDELTGGYAYPHADGTFEGASEYGAHGLTIRDVYIMAAMQALIPVKGEYESPYDLGVAACQYADGALKARGES